MKISACTIFLLNALPQLKQKLCDLGVHSLTVQPEFEERDNCCMDCAAIECKAGVAIEQVSS